MYWSPELINRIYNKNSNLKIVNNKSNIESRNYHKELELLKNKLQEKDTLIKKLLIENVKLNNEINKIKK